MQVPIASEPKRLARPKRRAHVEYSGLWEKGRSLRRPKPAENVGTFVVGVSERRLIDAVASCGQCQGCRTPPRPVHIGVALTCVSTRMFLRFGEVRSLCDKRSCRRLAEFEDRAQCRSNA